VRRALRPTGLALTVIEKAVQRQYVRLLRPAEKLHEPLVDRVMGQLTAGLSGLDAELPGSGWIGGDLGLADITVACAFGFTHTLLADVVETSRYPNLGALGQKRLRASIASPAVGVPASKNPTMPRVLYYACDIRGPVSSR
jgi:glutathione S-transferase